MGDTKEENASDNSRAWVIQAAGNFRTKIEDLKDDLASDFPEAKKVRSPFPTTFVGISKGKFLSHRQVVLVASSPNI